MADIEKELRALGSKKHLPNDTIRQRTHEAIQAKARKASPHLFLSWAIPAATAAVLAVVMLIIFMPGVPASLPSETPGGTVTAAVSPSTATDAVTAQGGVSYISIDINPSIELTIKYGVVLDAAAYNDDGTEILLGVTVPGMTPDQAVAALIAEFAAQGYISPDSADASIVITVYGDDEDNLLTGLQTTAAESLAGLGISCDIVASAVEPDIAQIARAAGITPGKYLLIQYLAERDGITIEAARDLYGDMKMKTLLGMVPDPEKVFGEDAYICLASFVPGLTPEQLELIAQAKLAYQTAMQTAVKAYNQAKEDARAYFQAARDAAHDAFKENHDKQAWQQAKSAAKAEMEQRYTAAKQEFTAAKTQAEEAFRTAVAGLGLTEEQIDALLEWDFDFEWDFDDDWAENPDSSETEQPSDDEEEDNENDGDDDDDDDDNGHGNGHS